jgi:hypothetical protein
MLDEPARAAAEARLRRRVVVWATFVIGLLVVPPVAIVVAITPWKPWSVANPSPVGVVARVESGVGALTLVMRDGSEIAVGSARAAVGDLVLLVDHTDEGPAYMSLGMGSLQSRACPIAVAAGEAWEEDAAIVFRASDSRMDDSAAREFGGFRLRKASAFRRPDQQDSDHYWMPRFCVNEHGQVLGTYEDVIDR